MPRRSLKRLLQDEFTGYTLVKFQQDALAGLSVAAVALPLALALGVASGAGAAAGLITSVLAGFIIGGLSGGPYQVSGASASMTAVLVMLSQTYGLDGIWLAGLMAGLLLLGIGLLRLGRFIAFIPSPVITGFTSGVALIIFIGQLDGFLGVQTPNAKAALFKLLGYFNGGFTIDWQSVAIGLGVIAIMALWPAQWNARFPSSLVGIILATLFNLLAHWPVHEIGAIPATLMLTEHFNPLHAHWEQLSQLVAPALTITALVAIESLLCGAVGSNMTGMRLQANQELIAQGIGNIIIPFFGGIPATAAAARSSVGIKSGGQTRMVSIIHAVGLLLSMFFLSPVMARIPITALAGVLMVTAWRMNEWKSIRFIFGRRFKADMLAFSLTLLATVTLDLTEAVLIGSFVVAAIFMNKIASMNIEIREVSPGKLKAQGIEVLGNCRHIQVAYLTGPLFFAAAGVFNEAFARLGDTHVLILSMRGVPLLDTSGLEALRHLYERLHKQGGTLMFAGAHENVQRMIERGGLYEQIGPENFFWSSDQAIVEAEKRKCKFCG